jgi:hypothetical protein
MQNKVYQYYKDLPQWAKGVAAVGSLAIVAAIGYSINKRIKFQKELAEANRQAKLAQDEIIILQGQGINPTYSDSQFEGFAQSLQIAMNSCGTDEEVIYNIFKMMKNGVDVRKLITAFGIRYYTPCAADQPISYARYLWDDKSFGGALSSWLTYDLTSSEVNKVNEILRTNNVNYSF